MQFNILVCGIALTDDWQEVEHKEAVYCELAKEDDFLEKISCGISYDLVVFAMEGARIQAIFNRYGDSPLFREFWQDSRIKKVAWSLDSHHQWMIEVQYQQFFSTYYVAHSNYMDKFSPDKAVWLPCALFVDHHRRQLLDLMASKSVAEKPFDIVSIYRNYIGIGDRNAVMNDYHQVLQERGLRTFWGQTSQHQENGMKRYYEALASGRIILNTSIIDDLNMRNFEAMALNQIMITNRVPDHAKIDLDYSNTVFFERYDLRSFAVAVDEALAKTKEPVKRTIDCVINQHMVIHRYVEIFNRELGLNLAVPILDVDAELAKRDDFTNDQARFVVDESLGDICYRDIDMKLTGLYAYVKYGRDTEAVNTVMQFATRPDIATDLAAKQDVIIAVITQCIERYSSDFRVEMLLTGGLKALCIALRQGGSLQVVAATSRLILEIESLQLQAVKSPTMIELKTITANILLQAANQFTNAEKYHEAWQCIEYHQRLGGACNSEIYCLIAKINRLLGNKEMALSYYKKALEE